jgi:undecaprenyl pyrophosphate phosphatase UppP
MKMKKIANVQKRNVQVKRKRRAGMEMVQVAILVAIAIVIGLIFREQIENFVNGVFENLSSGRFR